MDDAMHVLVDMNASIWAALTHSLEDLSEDEIHWRPLPEANTISLIVRHLRIEAEWHVDSLEHGAPMPTIAVSPSQDAIDAVPDDFGVNFTSLEKACARFLEILRATTLNRLQERTLAAYGKRAEGEGRRYFLGYHHATHLAMHCGQIRTIRNLFRKTRGLPARFVPENQTYPR